MKYVGYTALTFSVTALILSFWITANFYPLIGTALVMFLTGAMILGTAHDDQKGK